MYIAIVFIISILFSGGYFTADRLLITLLLTAYVVWYSFEKRSRVVFRFGAEELLLLLSVITSFWAVEKGRNLEGCVVFLGIVIFRIILGSLEESGNTSKGLEECKTLIFRVLSLTGVAMTVISVLVSPIDSLKEQFWQANRLIATFQYSNTCALFLFICLIFENHEQLSKKWMHYGVQSMLLLGLLLTGSRSTMLLLIVWGAYTAFTRKESRKSICAFAGGALVVAIAIFAVTGSLQNAGRLATVFTSNSTMWGRLLYYADALEMIIKHPFGLGYLGYYDVQGFYQHGVYTTKCVHNDFLQIALDYGVISFVVLVVYTVLQLVKGKQKRYQKEMLIMIAVASLVDLHMQFMAICLVAVLCLDPQVNLPYMNKKLVVKRDKMVISVCGLAGVAVLFLFTVGYRFIKSGNYDAAGKILKNNTKVLTEKMMASENDEEVLALANQILQKNAYSKEAWFKKSYVAFTNSEFEEMMECQDRLVELCKYNVALYQSYDTLLNQATELVENGTYSAEDQASYFTLFEEKKEDLRASLAGLESTTNPLAYKTRDLPVFTMDEEE